jgi:tetratricopeptide (TPR) repeat protein
MIQVIFFLQFRAQLRRTQPEMVSSLEKSLFRILEDAGGKVEPERRFFIASFNEDTLGFWLDMLFVIRSILEILQRLSSAIQGYSCVIDRDIPDYDRERLARALSYELGATGIWCSPKLLKSLAPYVNFCAPLSSRENERIALKPYVEGYAQIRNIKSFAEPISPGETLFRAKVERALERGARQNAVLVGPEFIGKREGLRHYCAGILGDIPPLVIRFGSGGRGLSCFGDVLMPQIRSFITGYTRPEVLDELDALDALIFRERLRNELSRYVIQKARYFFQVVLKNYIAAVKGRTGSPVLILENIHRADEIAARIFIDSYQALPEARSVLVYGTSSNEDKLKLWEAIFPRVIKFSSQDLPPPVSPEMSRDLWEIAYAVYFLGLFFPGALIPRLFGEEGKNPAMISLVFTLFSVMGVVDTVEDPLPRIRDFEARSEKILGEGRNKIHALVRRRLLAWVYAGKLRPCFDLLRVLSELGEEGDDELILNAIHTDVLNGTYRDIEKAIAEQDFERVVGGSRAPELYYIFKTLKALNYGDENAIRTTFQDPVPEGAGLLQYKIQILLNLTGYYLGGNNTKAALEMVKKAMLLSQEKRKNSSQAYRLFSLVNLAKGQIGETVEYISFSIENAEKTEQYDELGIAAYYAAGIQFLFGNISKALRFARQAEDAAASCGQGDWVDRSLFLRGKCCFETGRYQDALDIFRFLERNPSGVPSKEKESTLFAWTFRTMGYLGHFNTERSQALWGDLPLFEIESAYLAGDYERTLALAASLPPLSSESNFLYTEQPDWRSGFAQCECLVVAPEDLQNHILTTYQSLAVGRLASVYPEGSKDAIHTMQRLTRNELLPDMDPNDAFYFYALYRVLQDAGAAQIDMNTAVSMAFKRLQRRASRIDDPETRRDFLNLNYWNKALSLVAKEYKLI